MKRISNRVLAGLSALSLMCTAFSVSAQAAVQTAVPGAVQSDEETKTLGENSCFMGDINGDGEISFNDTVDLQRVAIGRYATYVYQTLYDKGWSKNAICAVLGNMDEESCGVNPGKHQAYDGPGYGIVQWDPASKYLNWAQNNGYADDSLEGQVAFLVESMQPGMGEWLSDNSSVPDGYGMSYSDFISSSADVSYLAQVFVYCYERPSEPHMDQRINYAVYWREKYFN